MTVITGKKAWAGLIVAHMCGLISLLALPTWVDTLISGYRFTSAEARALTWLFLASAVLCCLVIAPQYHKLNGRSLAPACFWLAAFCFLMMAQTDVFSVLVILHVIVGGAIGVAMSYSAGGMGKTSNPHRVFALGGLGLGLVAIVYLALMPSLIRVTSASALFWTFSAIMAFAGLFTSAFFPANQVEEVRRIQVGKFSFSVWCVLFGIMGLSINQFMVLSFVGSVGVDAGYSPNEVQLALVVMSLLAPIMAVLLQHRIAPVMVGMLVAFIQAGFALSIMSSINVSMYFSALLVYSSIMIFGHIFMFGLLAKIDPTGRAATTMPVLIMVGFAIGPILGGVLVQTSGYLALGIAALIIAMAAFSLFLRAKVSK